MAERVLVVGPAWIGDMVMAQSLFRLIKMRDPQAEIAVLAPDWSLPLLERMPEVAEGVQLALRHGMLNLKARWAVGVELRERFDRAIVLPRSFKAALVPLFARIPRRTGFFGEFRYGVLNDLRRLDKAALPRMVDRYLSLALEPGERLPEAPEPHLKVDPQNRVAVRRTLALDTSRPVVAFMPGAEYGPAKRWPISHFATLARRLSERGFTIWLLGGEGDRLITGTIAEQANDAQVVDLAGRTTLPEVIDLLSLAVAAVSNDSGLMHIAAAVGIPVVAIYGSSSPDYTPPLTQRAALIQRKEPCAPCFERTCRQGDYACLEKIRPEQVYQALFGLLEEM